MFPLPLGNPAVWIEYFSFSMELWVLKIPSIYFSIFPLECAFPVYLVIDELALEYSVVRLDGALSLTLSTTELASVF